MDSNSISSSTESAEIRFSIWRTFKHHIPRFILTMLVDIILPIIIYYTLQLHIKPVYALLLAGVPPFLMVIFKGILARTFDALAFLVFSGFIISGVIAIITRNAIVLLLEKSTVTGISSIVFGLTLIPVRCCHHRCRVRPLAYYFYQDLVPTTRAEIGLPENIFPPEEQQQQQQSPSNPEEEVLIPRLSDKQEVSKVYEWIYTHCSSFRFSCYMITGVWSIGLLSEFVVRLILILLHLSINEIFFYANVILTSVTIVCILLTIMFVMRERKQTIRFIEQWKREHLQLNL